VRLIERTLYVASIMTLVTVVVPALAYASASIPPAQQPVARCASSAKSLQQSIIVVRARALSSSRAANVRLAAIRVSRRVQRLNQDVIGLNRSTLSPGSVGDASWSALDALDRQLIRVNRATLRLDRLAHVGTAGSRSGILARIRTLTAQVIALRADVLARWHKLAWSDEFDGPEGAVPDRAKWQIMTGGNGHGNNELEYYTALPSNVALDGAGHLAITARRQTYSGGGFTCDFTSGEIATRGGWKEAPLYATAYGSIQASIKLPIGQGLWPAFWAMGADADQVGWPECGEIDIMENVGQSPFTVFGSIHGPTSTAISDGYGLTTTAQSTVSLASGFHVYGVNWSPNRVQMTLDGAPYATYTPTSLQKEQQWVFDKPFFLILNLAVGGTGPGTPAATTRFPGTMLVAWVRVYSWQ
jgi:beta-glucanase (GH16 family)